MLCVIRLEIDFLLGRCSPRSTISSEFWRSLLHLSLQLRDCMLLSARRSVIWASPGLKVWQGTQPSFALSKLSSGNERGLRYLRVL